MIGFEGSSLGQLEQPIVVISTMTSGTTRDEKATETTQNERPRVQGAREARKKVMMMMSQDSFGFVVLMIFITK
jgi:hypothetical protein